MLRRARDSWMLPAASYAGIWLVLVVVSWQTIAHSQGYAVAGPLASFPGGAVLAGWVRWDSGWYTHIATAGYDQLQIGQWSPVAFFPGYPLAMRMGGQVIGNEILAGISISIACGFGSALIFWRWCRDQMGALAASTSLLLLLLFPYSYYLYGVVYADALFLCAALGAFYAMERDHPLLAGILGAVATFTRPVGLAVTVALVVVALERSGVLGRPNRLGLPTQVRVRAGRPRDALVLLSIGGLGSYCALLWRRFDDPLMFSTVQRYWGQTPSPRTWAKAEFFDHLAQFPGLPYTWGLVVQGLLALSFLAAVPLIARRFGLGYAAYVLVVVGMPLLGSKDFHGLGRYVIAAFPVFALAGERLASVRPHLRRPVLVGSGTGLASLTAGFAHGFYLA